MLHSSVGLLIAFGLCVVVWTLAISLVRVGTRKKTPKPTTKEDYYGEV